MENATQALLIAGGVLLAIMILSIGVIIYISHNETAEAINNRWEIAELNKYNSTFELYIDRTDITAQELVTLANLSKQRNNEIAIYVKTTTGTIRGNNNIVAWDKNKLSDFLNDHILTTQKEPTGAETKQNLFSYKQNSIKYDDKTGKIIEISFNEK